ncbi:MAG: hypothetical protein ACLP07_15225 [Terracidiphilus sp.]
MKVKTLSWILLAVLAVAGVALLNYWASFQPLSTLVYSGFVVALAGLANLVFPFRFLGVRKRTTGALVLAGGVGLAVTALLWPAATVRVAQPGSRLDAIMPEYQFSEKHLIRIHARPEQVLQATRDATWSDMKSLITLLKIRGAVTRAPFHDTGAFSPDKRILDAFAASGSLIDTSEHELVTFNAVNMRERRPSGVHTLQEFVDYRMQGGIKTAYAFNVEDAGGGWSTLTAETRMMVYSDSTRGPAIYWRLIVPGSGLLRREWLNGIKRRAETGR